MDVRPVLIWAARIRHERLANTLNTVKRLAIAILFQPSQDRIRFELTFRQNCLFRIRSLVTTLLLEQSLCLKERSKGQDNNLESTKPDDTNHKP